MFHFNSYNPNQESTIWNFETAQQRRLRRAQKLIGLSTDCKLTLTVEWRTNSRKLRAMTIINLDVTLFLWRHRTYKT